MSYKTDPIHTALSLYEIVANSATHAVGVGLSIAGLVVLIMQAVNFGDPWYLGGVIAYGVSLILLYLASTVYHSTPGLRGNGLLQRLDHAAIFVLIAGTYTPFLLTKLRGTFGWITLGLIWGLTLATLVAKLVLTQTFTKPPVWLYVVMGWFGLLVFNQAMRSLSTASLVFLLVGGIFYTSGILFYKWKQLPFSHAIWHLFVISGSTFHFFSVMQLV
jgi:hemolysin III